MKSTTIRKNVCIPTLKVVGDYWTLRIVDALAEGSRRFCEIQRAIDPVSTVTLTNRLKRLEEAKVISRSELSRADVEYALTTKGKKVLPIIDAINDFSAPA